jgi:hypothetical protein
MVASAFESPARAVTMAWPRAIPATVPLPETVTERVLDDVQLTLAVTI